MNTHRKASGFTLIELIITMLVAAILIMAAYPSYQSSILKSHRSDAMAALSSNQTIFERCYAQNFSYTTACTALPTFPYTSPQGYYTISVSNLTTSTFTLTATAIGTQVKDTKCRSFSITQANSKTALDSGGASQTSCWNP